MSDYDDRLATLERRMTALELRQFQDEKKIEKNTPTVHTADLDDIKYHIVALKGLAIHQGEDLARLEVKMDTRFDTLEVRYEGLEFRFEHLEGQVTQLSGQVGNLEGQMEQLKSQVNQRFETQDKKLDQILQLLTQRPE